MISYYMWYSNVENFKGACGYTIDGIWYPRVTSIVSIKAKPALIYFYAGLPNYATGQAITKKSAEEGTLIHDTIEAILKKKPVVIPDHIKPTIGAFMDFYNNNEVVAHKIEEQLISKKHHYAGTMDILAEVNGVLGVLDIKTSIAVYRDYSIQTSAYVEALREDPNVPPLTRWILRVDQSRYCAKCPAKLREKGGNIKIRGEKKNKFPCDHQWSEMKGEYELKELGDFETDIKAFLACKGLWEWENEYWLNMIKKNG
jgi:hypothetical protein